jgi:1-acyl-sn-glycerol-3-phosphate acyltransferase
MSSNLLYEFACGLVRLYAGVMLKMDILWHADLPAGAKLFVANHPSGTDPFLIHLLSQMSVLITANAFAFPLFGTYIRKAGQIPVLPSKGDQAFEEARQLLVNGGSVGIFPEGTYSPQDGTFREPRSGAARLAFKTGVAVIPVGIHLVREKSFHFSMKMKGVQMGGYWYLYGPYAMTVGKPMYFHGNPDDRESVRIAARKMMDAIRLLASESETRLQQVPTAITDIPTSPAQ